MTVNQQSYAHVGVQEFNSRQSLVTRLVIMLRAIGTRFVEYFVTVHVAFRFLDLLYLYEIPSKAFIESQAVTSALVLYNGNWRFASKKYGNNHVGVS
jgi:hypothetical protein